MGLNGIGARASKALNGLWLGFGGQAQLAIAPIGRIRISGFRLNWRPILGHWTYEKWPHASWDRLLIPSIFLIARIASRSYYCFFSTVCNNVPLDGPQFRRPLQQCMADDFAQYALTYQWNSVFFDCLELTLGRSAVNRSILCAGDGGTNSDFTGGANGWGIACGFLQAAGRSHGFVVDLSTKTTCDP